MIEMDPLTVQALRDEIAGLRREVAALRSEIAPYTRLRTGAHFTFGVLVLTGLLALAIDRIWDLAVRLFNLWMHAPR